MDYIDLEDNYYIYHLQKDYKYQQDNPNNFQNPQHYMYQEYKTYKILHPHHCKFRFHRYHIHDYPLLHICRVDKVHKRLLEAY